MNAVPLDPLLLQNDHKIVLLVLDGLGDLPHPDRQWKTPLEVAATPNLDAIAPASAQGRLLPVAPGITPGSGPGHLGLFGYDPATTAVGRGVLEALGAGLSLAPGDVAARANFCTLDARGIVTDRRAGRIPTETCARLVSLLRAGLGRIEDVEVILEPGKGHRFVVLLRGPGLSGGVSDADPHHEGAAIPPARPLTPEAAKTGRIVDALLAKASQLLKNESPANGVLMRGVSGRPNLTGFRERFGLRAAAIAAYPMYRGVAQLAGMTVVDVAGETPGDAFLAAAGRWSEFDFFFVHVKGTDMAGEDGNFDAKVAVIETVDRALPDLLRLEPHVLCITGDHSTPVLMKQHSWHPVPALIRGPWCGADHAPRFHEKASRIGSLGTVESRHLMALLLANAGRLDKFGA